MHSGPASSATWADRAVAPVSTSAGEGARPEWHSARDSAIAQLNEGPHMRRCSTASVSTSISRPSTTSGMVRCAPA